MRLLSIAFVTAASGIAVAQPTPPPQPPQPPVEPTPPADTPTPPADTPTPPPQGQAQPEAPPATTPQPTAEPTPPPVTEPPAPEPKKDEKPAVKAVYDDGVKLSTEDGKWSLKFSFKMQMRFESNRPLDDTTPSGASSQFTNRFYIPRSRMQVTGNIFGKQNRYNLHVALGDSGGFSFVKDAFVEKKLGGGPVWFRFGQWKYPFNRAFLVSAFSNTFNERSIQNNIAGSGRDVGIAVHNDYEKSPEGLGWVLGMYNRVSGGNDSPSQKTTCTTNAMTGALTCMTTRPSNVPTDFGPALVARAEWNSPKMKGYSEGDLEGGPLRYSVGVAYKIDLANFTDQQEDSWADNMTHGLEGDVMIKAQGFHVHAGALVIKNKSKDALYGVFVQPNMMLVPKKTEIAGRFAYITGDEAVPDRGQIEARAAFNYFFKGHTYKLANDIGFVKRLGEDAMGNTDKPDLQARFMLQLSI